MNDAIQSIGGDILQNTQPFTQEMANMGWRALQEFLANLGFSRSKKPLVLTGFPAIQNAGVPSDPATQTQLTWQFYFDGTSYWYPPNVQVLPQDMIMPLRIWERFTGSYLPFCPMEMSQDALPDWVKGPSNGMWLWENDTLYMPGATYPYDLRMEYAAFLPDFVTTDTTPWYEQPVPIMRSEDALSWYICAEAAGPRKDLSAAEFVAKAESAARKIFNREVSMKQRTPASRRCQSGHGYRTYRDSANWY